MRLHPPHREKPHRSARRLRRARNGRAWGTLLVIATAVGIVIVPVASLEIPREVARWHVAAATESALNGDYSTALGEIERAMAWDPANPAWLLLRASYRLETGAWQEGLSDCDQLARLLPDDRQVGELRSSFLHHLGRHREAITEWRNILRASGPLPAIQEQHLLNGLAYATAIGGLDLEDGRFAVEKALQIVANVPAIFDPGGVLDFGRAVTAQELGQTDEAVQFATSARDSAELALQQVSRKAARTDETDPSAAVRRNEEQALRAHLAGILEFRSQVNDELGRADDAAEDRRRKQELTSAGNLAEVRPYGLEIAVARVESCASILDTRGFVLYRLGMYEEALNDLDLALAAYKEVSRTLPAFIEARKHLIIDMRQENRQEDQVRRTLAVIRYHRSLTRDALSQTAKAEEDRTAIRELGFVPDEHLF